MIHIFLTFSCPSLQESTGQIMLKLNKTRIFMHVRQTERHKKQMLTSEKGEFYCYFLLLFSYSLFRSSRARCASESRARSQRPALQLLLQAAAETTGKEDLKADRRVRHYNEVGLQEWPLARRATVPRVLYGIKFFTLCFTACCPIHLHRNHSKL